MNIKSTKVFKINGRLVVADSIEDAIRIFRENCSSTIEIEHVLLITGDRSNLAWIDRDMTLTYEPNCPQPPTFDDAPPIPSTFDDAPLTPLTDEEIEDINNYLNEPGI